MPLTDVKFSVVAAVGLVKRGLLGLPSPYVVVTIDAQPVHTTNVVRKNLHPQWNSNFDVVLNEGSVIVVEVFDIRRSIMNDQSSLGLVQINSGEILRLQPRRRQTFTMDLKPRFGGPPVHGQVIIQAIKADSPEPTQTIHSRSGSFMTSLQSLASRLQDAAETSPRHPLRSQAREILATVSPSLRHAVSIPHLAAQPHSQHRRHDTEPSQNTPSASARLVANTQTPTSPLQETAEGTPQQFDSSRSLDRSLSHLSRTPFFRPRAPSPSLSQQELPPSIAYRNSMLPPWLPSGWELRHTTQGRPYYVDHNTQTTSWVPPPVSDPSARRTESRGEGPSSQPMPAGWERRITPDGRTYYVDHNTRTTSWNDPRVSQPPAATSSAAAAAQTPASAGAEASSNQRPLPSGWQMRMTETGRLYYVDHNSRRTTWEDPRLPSQLDADAPQYKRDFRQKVVHFRSQSALAVRSGSCEIKLRRNQLFEDAFREIMRRTPDQLKKRLDIKFDGEIGLDFGGLTKEFFFILSHEMFNPVYCLFEYSDQDNYTLQINAASDINPEHLSYFKFIGRCMGLAIFHRQLLDAYFVVGFYKMLLDKKVTLPDLESVDATLHKSMVWMLENDITDIIYETFSITEERFGEMVTTELKPNGENISVTEENKQEYVNALVQYRIARRVKPQFDALMSGFNELISPDTIKLFDERELELLISGMSDIQVDDLDRHTDYRGYEKTDDVIQWFWKCIRGWPTDRQARLLQFATGTSRVPVNGFKDLQGSDGPRRFTIEKWGNPSHLPRSHTCFNRIDLPPYNDYETLEQKLIIAVEETLGFGEE